MDSKHYWDSEAEGFDSIYASDGNVKGWLNRLLRGDMYGRYLFALRAMAPESRPAVLEIGCGTGVHTRGFLEAGASSVTGVDISPGMLKIAAERLKNYGDRAALAQGDFMSEEAGKILAGRTFDVVTAIGVFDYVASPLEFTRKAISLAGKRFIATFPRSGTARALLRHVRLKLKGCPVYFYSKEQIESLAEQCGVKIAQHEIIGQLHCAVFDLL